MTLFVVHNKGLLLMPTTFLSTGVFNLSPWGGRKFLNELSVAVHMPKLRARKIEKKSKIQYF